MRFRSSSPPFVPSRFQQGVTLLEIMVAVGIFSLIIIGVVLGIVQFQYLSRSASEEAVAHTIAVQIMEQIKNAPDFNSVAYGGAVNSILTLPASASATRDYQIDPLLSKIGANGQPTPVRFGIVITNDSTYGTPMKTVRVRVIWPGRYSNSVRIHYLQSTVTRGYMQF